MPASIAKPQGPVSAPPTSAVVGPTPRDPSGLSPVLRRRPRTSAARADDLRPERYWQTVLLPTLGTFLILTAAVVWNAYDETLESHLGRGWVLTIGLAISALVSTLVFHAFRGQARRDATDRNHLRALEKLNEIAIAISSRIDSPPDVLKQLASAARELLAMDRSGVVLLDSVTLTLKVVAFSGDIPPNVPTKFSLSRLPLCRRLLDKGESLLVEDVSRDELADVNRDVLATFLVDSMIVIPLHIGDRKLGLLTLSSSRPRQFTAGDRRLANLLGSQAAVILANSELYARMAESLRTQQRLFEQREALFAVNAAVYQAAGFRESLQTIAELAPGVLNVDLCMVTLLAAEDPEKSMVAAITQPHGADLVGKVFTRRGTNAEVVRATRRMLVVEDARHHPGVHPSFRDRLDVGSVAYLPLLRTGGEFMGTLVMIRRASGPFAPEQLNLAELFAVRAAAAIENAQLLDQTRRDAQAKTMLLRELNHRVKNNLASIITLLSLEEPDLSPTARQWLDRAIDRIRTMARAHDLFSSGAERVSLTDLVAQTLPSLSVAKPPAVELKVELNGAGEVLLRTDRAVSLAMALHELCYNAIIHGVGRAGRGTVTIRGRVDRPAKPNGQGPPTIDAPANARVVLEVIDEAPRAPDDGESNTAIPVRVGAGGLGLMLVDGLVTRELGGAFTLSGDAGQGPNRGSVARVEFPLPAEERQRVVTAGGGAK